MLQYSSAFDDEVAAEPQAAAAEGSSEGVLECVPEEAPEVGAEPPEDGPEAPELSSESPEAEPGPPQAEQSLAPPPRINICGTQDPFFFYYQGEAQPRAVFRDLQAVGKFSSHTDAVQPSAAAVCGSEHMFCVCVCVLQRRTASRRSSTL